jgi:hypothetical protein
MPIGPLPVLACLTVSFGGFSFVKRAPGDRFLTMINRVASVPRLHPVVGVCCLPAPPAGAAQPGAGTHAKQSQGTQPGWRQGPTAATASCAGAQRYQRRGSGFGGERVEGGVNPWPRPHMVLTCSTGPSVDPQVQRSMIWAGAVQVGSGQGMLSGIESSSGGSGAGRRLPGRPRTSIFC